MLKSTLNMIIIIIIININMIAISLIITKNHEMR